MFDAPIRVWQVPRDAYRQVLASQAELDPHVRTAGPLGEPLADALARVAAMAGVHGVHLGGTYILGDSPFVLLTALQSAFEPDASSSRYVELPAPSIDDDGQYVAHLAAAGSVCTRTWTTG